MTARSDGKRWKHSSRIALAKATGRNGDGIGNGIVVGAAAAVSIDAATAHSGYNNNTKNNRNEESKEKKMNK